MTRRLSLRSYASRAKEAAAELGQRVAAITVEPSGSVRVEFAPAVADPAAVAQDGPPNPRIVPDGKSPRVRAAA
jgi:hypothetical protein